jgi:gas vesicle protein
MVMILQIAECIYLDLHKHSEGEIEMGKRNLLAGILLGAVVGGITTLFNRETRAYTKEKLASCKVKTGEMMKHPSEAVRNARMAFNELNERLSHNAENVINALEQVENTLGKVSGDKEEKRLP